MYSAIESHLQILAIKKNERHFLQSVEIPGVKIKNMKLFTVQYNDLYVQKKIKMINKKLYLLYKHKCNYTMTS